jgi:hypothetical protein
MKVVRIRGTKFIFLTTHIDTIDRYFQFELGINFIPGKFGLLFYTPLKEVRYEDW